jgi:enoyl-CoA hydratase/carnithine racemase
MMDNPVLRVEGTDGCRVLTLTRPPVNALGADLVQALGRVLDSLAGDASVGVVHLRAEGKAFCAGADLAEMAANLGPAGSLDAQIAFVRSLQQVFARLEALPQVTIAEIGGAALGGGLELALACDLRIAANEARLALPEVGLGLIPGAGGTQRLTRLCGAPLARRLILGAETIDGASAATLGVVHWAVPRADLAATATAHAARLAALPRAALGAAKACIAAALDPERDGFEEELSATRALLTLPETRALVDAFLAGRR